MRPRRSFRDDERALAGVVGFVLILALAVSYYGFVVHNSVPRWGAESERAWDGLVAGAMGQLASDAENGRAQTATALLPRPPEAQGLDVPFFGRTQPIAPGGALSFSPAGSCGGIDVVRTAQGRAPQTTSTLGGCLRFNATPVYTGAFGYVYENGALLRLQDGEAVLLRGPHLALIAVTDGAGAPVRLDATLRLEELAGRAFSLDVQNTDAHVSLASEGASEAAPLLAANADRVSIVVRTDHPVAWKRWLDARFDAARVNEPLFCPSAACATSVADEADGSVTIVLEGPRGAGEGDDVAFTPLGSRLLVAPR